MAYAERVNLAIDHVLGHLAELSLASPMSTARSAVRILADRYPKITHPLVERPPTPAPDDAPF